MRHLIIGTAGHVDHGKTALIKALTGIDTDRLTEEKQRGITIESGFAYLDFPDGQRVGIVDVPGHEKFIGNMLAGACGVDIAMLVTAADEGVKPQTVEHLDILSLLGVKQGLLVLTKTDLAGEEQRRKVKSDLRKLSEGTFLENAPVVEASAKDGSGIPLLKEALRRLCRDFPEGREQGGFRLPVDRCFSRRGAGTIVTGTLTGQEVKKGQEAVLYPRELPVRIRGIQVHNEETAQACPGQRTALNLAGIKKEEIHRGDVIAEEGGLIPSCLLDVRLEMLRHSGRSLKQGSRVHIYLGAGEVLGRAFLAEKEELAAGETGYAQLRLCEPAAALRGDRFVMRFYSPPETIGGGVVLDGCPRRHKRKSLQASDAFRIKESGSPSMRLEWAALEHRGESLPLRELALGCGLDQREALEEAQKLCRAGSLFLLGGDFLIHRKELEYLENQTVSLLEEYHGSHPLQPGMKKAEAAGKIGVHLGQGLAGDFLKLLVSRKTVLEEGDIVRLPSFRPAGAEENPLLGQIEGDYLAAGYGLPATQVYAGEHQGQKEFPAAFAALAKRGVLIRLNSQYCIHSIPYARAKSVFEELAGKQGEVGTGEFRDALGCSRKVAIAILEHFDKRGYTGRTEKGRTRKN